MATSRRKVGAVRYDLTTISRAEFNNFHSAVQAVFDQGHQHFSPELLTMTSSPDSFPKQEQADIAKYQAMGLTFKLSGEEHGTFHIWINPAYTVPSWGFYDTLAHELVHGYAGVGYGHKAHWRRWYYRTMWHLKDLELMDVPDDLDLLCYAKGIGYNHSPHKQKELHLVWEAFSRAEDDRDKVRENYFRRISA